jgi:hypothetical protein
MFRAGLQLSKESTSLEKDGLSLGVEHIYQWRNGFLDTIYDLWNTNTNAKNGTAVSTRYKLISSGYPNLELARLNLSSYLKPLTVLNELNELSDRCDQPKSSMSGSGMWDVG